MLRSYDRIHSIMKSAVNNVDRLSKPKNLFVNIYYTN